MNDIHHTTRSTSQLPQIALDLRGMMEYAKSLGKKVVELTESEKEMFVK